MRNLLLFCLIALFYPSPVRAVDLNIKDPIISGLEITVNASFSGSANNYLQGTLRSVSSSRYFGETQNLKGDWIDYISSPEKEYITSNFFLTDVKNASWSGQLKLRFKIDDPNYLGPGIYDLKLRRFTGSSTSNAGESNTLSISLSAPLATSTPSPSPSPSPSQTQIPTPTPSPSPTPTPKPSLKPSPSPSPDLSPPPEGTVAGVSTEINLTGFGVSPSPNISLDGLDKLSTKPTLNKSRLKTVLLIGSGLIVISLAGFFGYRKYIATMGK